MEIVAFLVITGVAVVLTRRLLERLERRHERDRKLTVQGIPMTVHVGPDTELGAGTVVRVDPVGGPILSLLVSRDRVRLFVNVEPLQPVELSDPSFEAHFHVWSDDVGLARWWLSRSVRELLVAAGSKWGFKIDSGVLEAHVPAAPSEASWLPQGLAAAAALASRGRALEDELREARKELIGTRVAMDLVREDSGAIFTRTHTRTRFLAPRAPNQAPFVLEPHLVDATRRLYDEVAPLAVEADERMLHLDLEGVVTDPDAVVRAAQLAARLAEPAVIPLDEGPYR